MPDEDSAAPKQDGGAKHAESDGAGPEPDWVALSETAEECGEKCGAIDPQVCS